MYLLYGYVLICFLLQTAQGSQKCNTGNQTFVNCTRGCCQVDNTTNEQCCPAQYSQKCNIGNQTFINCTNGCCPLNNSTYEQCCSDQAYQESTKVHLWAFIWVGTSLTIGLVTGALLLFCYCKNPYTSQKSSSLDTPVVRGGPYPCSDKPTLLSSVSSYTNTTERQDNRKKPTLPKPQANNKEINIPGQPLVSERVSDSKMKKLPQFTPSSGAFPGKGYRLGSGSPVEFNAKNSNSNCNNTNMS